MDISNIDDLNSPEQFPEPYQSIAYVIGVDGAIELAKKFGGTGVYFPKYENVTRISRDRAICREFDGANYKKLALKYNLTEVRVRNIISARK